MKGKRQTARVNKTANRSQPREHGHNEETTFLFLGNKVMDELRVLARIASPNKNSQGEG